MKRKIFLSLAALIGLLVLAIAAAFASRPWMDHWGANEAEIAATLPGDEFVPAPVGVVNRVVIIHATPEQIYPWLVQIGAGRGGLYSYTWLETMMNCPLVNADRIHPEWQDLKPGDKVKMCPGDFGPRPFDVAAVLPNQAVILGHQKQDGAWSDTWQFVLQPAGDGVTRLILRSRAAQPDGFSVIIHPGIFIMERGMLSGIKERAEKNTQS